MGRGEIAEIGNKGGEKEDRRGQEDSTRDKNEDKER